jgi:hypothetical protein
MTNVQSKIAVASNGSRTTRNTRSKSNKMNTALSIVVTNVYLKQGFGTEDKFIGNKAKDDLYKFYAPYYYAWTYWEIEMKLIRRKVANAGKRSICEHIYLELTEVQKRSILREYVNEDKVKEWQDVPREKALRAIGQGLRCDPFYWKADKTRLKQIQSIPLGVMPFGTVVVSAAAPNTVSVYPNSNNNRMTNEVAVQIQEHRYNQDTGTSSTFVGQENVLVRTLSTVSAAQSVGTESPLIMFGSSTSNGVDVGIPSVNGTVTSTGIGATSQEQHTTFTSDSEDHSFANIPHENHDNGEQGRGFFSDASNLESIPGSLTPLPLECNHNYFDGSALDLEALFARHESNDNLQDLFDKVYVDGQNFYTET